MWPTIAECLINSILLVIYVICIIKAPEGIIEIIEKVNRRNDDGEDIGKIILESQKKETNNILESIHKNFGRCCDQSTYFKEKIFKAIDYAINRHDWYENQRLNIFKSILAISSIIFTVIGLFISDQDTISGGLRVSICSLGFITLIALLRAVYLYNIELDADRPYRLVSDIKAWYFKYNMPPSNDTNKDNLKISEIANGVLDERINFVNRNLENTKIENAIREDLEQIFILQILQKYKQQSLTKLRWLFSYFVSFTGILIMTTFISEVLF